MPAARAPLSSQEQRERYTRLTQNPVHSAAEQPFSTFSVDVDTASYANVRRFLRLGNFPPADSVRVEEMINYFRYDLPKPASKAQPFSVTLDAARTPWNAQTRLIRVALNGYDVRREARPPANLVFLVDVSGSMADADKLPLVKETLKLLARQMRPDDRVSIVTYSGKVELALPPTSDPDQVVLALGRLNADGSTAGGEALKIAYATARAARIADGVNRIILATDGDFNVGITDPDELKAFVARNRNDGITLTTLGFGQGNYSDQMMETLADAGNGNYAYIDGISEARKVLADELSSTLFTIAQDVKVQVEFNPAVVSEYRLVGYEDRLLATEDFANDKVDAGDIGAGHQVTAFYEVSLKGSGGARLPARRYGKEGRHGKAKRPAAEAAFVQLRYKLPGATVSNLIRRPLSTASVREAGAAQGDFAFAAAVAAFGQQLRGGKYLGGFSYPQILSLAGEQTDFHRQEFVELVKAAAGAAR
jgi:Ca-activated chloride channel family protein